MMDQGYQAVGQPPYLGGMANGEGYLPPFLMGSPASAKSPHSGFSSNYRHTKTTPTLSTHPQHYGPMTDTTNLAISHKAPMDRAGPPVQGLYDNTASPKSSTPMTTSSPARRQLNFTSFNSLGQASPMVNYHTPASEGLNMSGVHQQHIQSTKYLSPAQIDPFYTQGEDLLTGNDLYQQCWVTVYGFPPASASFILEQFAQYGTILKHVICSNGNWMHILYQSKLQAKKALSKNGKVFGSDIMVGVQPCIDKSVIESEQSTVANSLTTTIPNRSLGNMRPLTAAYHATQAHNEVVPSNPNTPHKDNGFIAKAMEYFFGW
ncbi:nucleoporin NUP35-like [Dysidea avara]|uniref:nucleoporin NUP35-like n=1 Tax=Dysidea avara TaxID=196820 RepID=UPI00332AC423